MYVFGNDCLFDLPLLTTLVLTDQSFTETSSLLLSSNTHLSSLHHRSSFIEVFRMACYGIMDGSFD